MNISEHNLRGSWPSQEEDMADAWAIVSKYHKRDGAIRFIEDVECRGDQIKVCWPDWVMELHRHLERKYGSEQGGLVGQKIMARMAAGVVIPAADKMH